MNANQIHGTIRAIAGKAQEQADHVLGNRRRGCAVCSAQVLGAAEKRLGDFQEAARRTVSHGVHL